VTKCREVEPDGKWVLEDAVTGAASMNPNSPAKWQAVRLTVGSMSMIQ